MSTTNDNFSRELLKCIITQIKNWPTAKRNIKKNCEIFKQLNEVTKGDLIVKGFDPNCEYYKLCANYAFVTQALIQRGLMNLTYYLLLDEFVNAKLSGGGQDGGMNIKDLFHLILVSFFLLGRSEGSQSANVDSTAIKTNNDDNNISIFTQPETVAQSLKELTEMRKFTAEKKLQQLIHHKPWSFVPNEITVATGITKEQAKFIEKKIGDLNSNLSSASNTAKQQCIQNVQISGELNVFNNDDFIKQVKEQYNANVKNAISAERTSDSIQDITAYGINAATNAYTALYRGLEGNRPGKNTIDETALFKQSYASIAENRNSHLIEQLEGFETSFMYQLYCKSSPNPQFILKTYENDDGYSVNMSTIFGNDGTGTLLLYHFDTVQRIKMRMGVITKTDKEYNHLKSLLEKMQTQIKLIESSALFAPLDIVSSSMISLENIIAEGDIATKKYEELVKNLLEAFPISDLKFERHHEFEQLMFEQKQIVRKNVLKEWAALIDVMEKGGAKLITDGVGNGAKVAGVLIEEVAGVANKATDEGAEILNNVAKGAVKVVSTSAQGIADNLWLLLPLILTYGGIAAATAFFILFFKKSLFTFSTNTTPAIGPSQQQPVEKKRRPGRPKKKNGGKKTQKNGGKKTKKINKKNKKFYSKKK